MRIGLNPNKDQPLSKAEFWHQIIVPVYIPNQEGYFKDSLAILENCLSSVHKTTHSSTFISVINNGSCKEVTSFLEDLRNKNKIHELISTSNIGKLNAIYKGLVGHDFPFITIADADTLFLTRWQQETMSVFKNYPKAGTVGIVPQFNMFSNYCTNVIFDNFFNPKMKFYKVGQPEEMRKFYQSLGWKMKSDHYYLNSILGLEKNGIKACVGSGHFVATYRKEVFTEIKKYIPSKMGNNSEKLLDRAPMKAGLWKLTTFNNYAYHMGNVFEPWMLKNKLYECDNYNLELNDNFFNKKSLETASFNKFMKNKLFKKLLRISVLNRWFLAYKGLKKDALKQYPKIYY